jgi:2-polyprenyl-3-methyl-5-hydroxy-6-metoxy-1,4-benzoquinol methylase
VWCIDGNAEAVKKAKEVCVDAKVMDLNDVPDAPVFDQKFDVIVYADVLEHLLYPEEVLRHFNEYLVPGGKVIVSVPNVALWRVRLNLLLGRFDYTDYGVLDRTHVHLYTFKSARELMEAVKFKNIRVHGAANALGPVIARLPFLGSLLGIHVIAIATV